jgi:TrkA domain protein
MQIMETDLPGIGKKYTLSTRSGVTYSVIIHSSGKREIYRFEQDQDVPSSVTELTDEEARQVGSILSGSYFQPTVVDKTELVMKEMIIEWFALEESSPLAGHSIRELAIRKKSGASIIAVLRSDQVIPSPSPEEELKPEDTLMVAGNREQVLGFKKTFMGDTE